MSNALNPHSRLDSHHDTYNPTSSYARSIDPSLGRTSPANSNLIPGSHHHHHHHPQPHHPIHSNSPNPTTTQMGSPSPSTISEDKLIDALINKIMAKLSNQADPHLSPLETDELIRQSCSSLFEMCRQRLPFVIHKLLQELDSPSHVCYLFLDLHPSQ